jgi:Na+/H+-dicarboxylate symporter
METVVHDSWGEKMVRFLTVSEFSSLLSRQNMLAFVIFSFLVGIATRKSGASAETFRKFINSGNVVMGNLLVMVMNLAPIGLGAYFAYQVGTLALSSLVFMPNLSVYITFLESSIFSRYSVYSLFLHSG